MHANHLATAREIYRGARDLAALEDGRERDDATMRAEVDDQVSVWCHRDAEIVRVGTGNGDVEIPAGAVRGDGRARTLCAEVERVAPGVHRVGKTEQCRDTDGLLLRGSLAEYEAAFDAADGDGDGLVGATELADLLRALGRPVTYDELVATMRDFDVDASGKLDFFEVLRMFKKSVLDLDEVREEERRERERESSLEREAFFFLNFFRFIFFRGTTKRKTLTYFSFPLPPLLPSSYFPSFSHPQVLDYVRLTPTKKGAALDAAAHSERRKTAKAAAAAAAAGGAATLEGGGAATAEDQEASRAAAASAAAKRVP